MCVCVSKNQSNNKVWKLLHIPSDFRCIHFFNWPLWRISLFPYLPKATNGRASHRPFPPHLEVRKEACDVPSFRSLLCIWPSQRWTFCWIKSGQSINPSIKMNQGESKYVKMNQGESRRINHDNHDTFRNHFSKLNHHLLSSPLIHYHYHLTCLNLSILHRVKPNIFRLGSLGYPLTSLHPVGIQESSERSSSSLLKPRKPTPVTIIKNAANIMDWWDIYRMFLLINRKLEMQQLKVRHSPHLGVFKNLLGSQRNDLCSFLRHEA